MNNPTRTAGKARRVRLALALVAAATFPALAAAPAQAHDSLTSTTPAKDTTVTAAPATVSLTLSEPPTDAASLTTSVIKVTDSTGATISDSTGATISDGKVTVSGATLSTTVIKGANGPYTVLWRAVSSDGHPIEGSYSFTVQDPTPAVTATAQPGQTAAATPTTTATQLAAAERVRPDDSNGPTVAAVVLIVVAGFFFSQRSRRNER
ncbi:copper resistance CopC family protein [Paenarthrobacter nitroguajacolicus]|uniref:copper resistance CopC family protein n=1 Tax=Paenarthrobacter nitroguajacolicus TaxID=211146 RepID=UPI001FCB7F8D|nr:copper resistance CopC family protein [Paenarthrobacter nitroguajacolicus]